MFAIKENPLLIQNVTVKKKFDEVHDKIVHIIITIILTYFFKKNLPY